MKEFMCDFETTNDPLDCRIWHWGAYDMKTDEFFQGKSIEDFHRFIRKQSAKASINIHFHNLKFDSEFLIYYLMKIGYTHSTESKLYPNQFSTLISDMRVYYSMKICTGVRRFVHVFDSLKVIPLRVDMIPKAFNLPYKKLSIDYNLKRPKGYEPTDQEILYLKADCQIVAKALNTLKDRGMTKMTAASNSLHSFKAGEPEELFRRRFPILEPEVDQDIRASYRGGYTYCNPTYQGLLVEHGNVFDVNSLYPYVMRHKLLPFGEPIRYAGEYEPDVSYPLYIQMIRCQFKIKPGYVPMIQLRNSRFHRQNEYVEDSEIIENIMLTSVDLEMFMEHYEVKFLEYIGGYKFRGSTTIFADFIDYWMNVKVTAEQEGNKGLRYIAKLQMNSLYGKWATSPHVRSSIPVFDREGDMVKYVSGADELKDPLYIPLASFITSYARQETITAIQNNFDRFLYCDTDSVHMIGEPIGLRVHASDLGAWKHEMVMLKGKFLRPKCYMEYGYDPKDPTKIEQKVTVAGMSDRIHDSVTFDNFELDTVFTDDPTHAEPGKKVVYIGSEFMNLRPLRVSGGVCLLKKDYTLRK